MMFGGGTTTFGQTAFGNTGTPTLGMTTTAATGQRDFEVASPPDDSISCLSFSPATVPSIFLIAGSWDNNVRELIKLIYIKYYGIG